ncbi:MULTISPECIES: hypothetical protein [unclassified Marinovum]
MNRKDLPPIRKSDASDRHSPEADPEEEDLWFMPDQPDDEPDYLSPLPRADPDEREITLAWEAAQSVHARRVAHIAARFGALDDRLKRAPEGWRHRLALLEASDLSWLSGDRVSVDRLGLWQTLRLSAADEDTSALQRAAWTFRRLSGGAGPDADLAAFLGRLDIAGDEPLSDKIEAWTVAMGLAAGLHPVVLGCFAFHIWPLTGIGRQGDILEGAVVAARLAASEGQGGALFLPVLLGTGGAPRGGPPAERLHAWLQASEQGILRAMRHLDDLERWEMRARAGAKHLSGRTPPRLIEILRDWPLVTAPMAEALTGASRAAVQRNLTWFEAQGLVQEVTGQGRFRVWRAV